MIPEYFKDYFISANALVQEQIVSSLLSLSTQGVKLTDNAEQNSSLSSLSGD